MGGAVEGVSGCGLPRGSELESLVLELRSWVHRQVFTWVLIFE